MSLLSLRALRFVQTAVEERSTLANPQRVTDNEATRMVLKEESRTYDTSLANTMLISIVSSKEYNLTVQFALPTDQIADMFTMLTMFAFTAYQQGTLVQMFDTHAILDEVGVHRSYSFFSANFFRDSQDAIACYHQTAEISSLSLGHKGQSQAVSPCLFETRKKAIKVCQHLCLPNCVFDRQRQFRHSKT